MSKIVEVTAIAELAKAEATPVQIDAMERLIGYATQLEQENDRLRKELAEANGDVPDADVRDAAQAIVAWIRDSIPDPADVETYVRSYLNDHAYTKEAFEKGKGHAKAMSMATAMLLTPVDDSEDA